MSVVPPDKGQVVAEVFSFELTGDSTLVMLKVNDQFVSAKAPKEFRVTMGQTVGFAIDPKQCYLFDRQTELRMRPA